MVFTEKSKIEIRSILENLESEVSGPVHKKTWKQENRVFWKKNVPFKKVGLSIQNSWLLNLTDSISGSKWKEGILHTLNIRKNTPIQSS